MSHHFGFGKLLARQLTLVLILAIGFPGWTIELAHSQQTVPQNQLSKASRLGLESLQNQVFADPTNIKLNFELLRAQVATNDLRGAESTLDRILLLDPNSKLARILYAELQYKLGRLAVAKQTLIAVIEDPATPNDMRKQAMEIYQLVDQQRPENKLRLAAYIGYGKAGNARGASKNRNILAFDLPAYNTTDDRSEAFYEYEISASYTQELAARTRRLLTYDFGVNMRDYKKYKISDTDIYTGSVTYQHSAGIGIQTNAMVMQRNDRQYRASAGLTLYLNKAITDRLVLRNSFGATRNFHFDHKSVAQHKDQNGATYTASGGVAGLVGPASFHFQARLNKTEAVVQRFETTGETVQVGVTTPLGTGTGSLSASRGWTRFGVADPFVSSKKRRDVSDRLQANITSAAREFGKDATISLKADASVTNTNSNIPNFDRKVNEIKVGASIKY